MSLFPPFTAIVDRATGDLDPREPLQVARVSDIGARWADQAAARRSIAAGDPVVYQMALAPVPQLPGHLRFAMVTVEPGDVGGECFMTKGHRHSNGHGEVYLGVAGVGVILLTGEATSTVQELQPDRIVYVPPGWAHRSVNAGTEPFRFLTVYLADTAHDYEAVLERGMGMRVRRSASGPRLVMTAGSQSRASGAD